jgi:hypothetical protein
MWQAWGAVDNYDGMVREIRASPGSRGEFAEAVADRLVSENLLVPSGAVATLPEMLVISGRSACGGF